MDISKASKFIFIDQGNHWNNYQETLYISKDLEKLILKNDNKLYGIYAVVDTATGPMLFETDLDFDNMPIITRAFLHESFIMKHYDRCDKIDI